MLSSVSITVLILVALSTPLMVQAPGKAAYLPEVDCTKGSFRFALPRTVAELRKIGPLKGEKLLDTLTWGDNTKSHIRELRFDGLIVAILADEKGQHYSLSSITIRDARWALAPNFKVGDTYAEVIRRLGLQQKVSLGQFHFSGDGDSVSFVVKDGRIAEIKGGCYTG